MSCRPDRPSPLLDLDRAGSAFALLFTFTRDAVCLEDGLYPFESVLSDVLQGLRLPKGGTARLRSIYDRVMREPEELRQLAEQVRRDLGSEREVLRALVSILLRLSVDEGYFCRVNRDRMQEVLYGFELNFHDVEQFSRTEQDLLAIFCYGPRADSQSPAALASHYATLDCLPDAPDEQVRSAYRKLVMECHPDRVNARDHSADTVRETRERFEIIQTAYEIIRKARSAHAVK